MNPSYCVIIYITATSRPFNTEIYSRETYCSPAGLLL